MLLANRSCLYQQYIALISLYRNFSNVHTSVKKIKIKFTFRASAIKRYKIIVYVRSKMRCFKSK